MVTYTNSHNIRHVPHVRYGTHSYLFEVINVKIISLLRLYQDKFGFIFIIFAKGKSSPEILEVLMRRYHALPYEELQAAAREQMKITELRLGQLLGVLEALEAQQRSQKRADQVLNQVMMGGRNTQLPRPSWLSFAAFLEWRYSSQLHGRKMCLKFQLPRFVSTLVVFTLPYPAADRQLIRGSSPIPHHNARAGLGHGRPGARPAPGAAQTGRAQQAL